MSGTTIKLIEDFSKIGLEKQKNKVIEMLKLLQESDQLFKDLLVIVENKKDIVSQDVIDVYADILALADAIKESDTEKGNEILQKIKVTIQKIHDAEEAERKGQNPDDLLKNL